MREKINKHIEEFQFVYFGIFIISAVLFAGLYRPPIECEVYNDAIVSVRFMEENWCCTAYFVNFKIENGEIINRHVSGSDYWESTPGKELKLTICNNNDEYMEWR